MNYADENDIEDFESFEDYYGIDETDSLLDTDEDLNDPAL